MDLNKIEARARAAKERAQKDFHKIPTKWSNRILEFVGWTIVDVDDLADDVLALVERVRELEARLEGNKLIIDLDSSQLQTFPNINAAQPLPSFRYWPEKPGNEGLK